MRTRTVTVVVLTLITLYGALLRLDALTVKYGWLEQPAWTVRIEQALLPVSRALLPANAPWGRVEKPYVGGDPINYLRFAREMQSFYQAHVREPVFLAITRGMLWLLRNSDIAVSYASLLTGTLAIVATYLLGTAACSRAAGLIAAAALAIELEAVTWAVDGWRDDTFMFFVALSAWAFVRLMQLPTIGWAVTAGVVAGGACLTRITSLSFVVPALVWIAAGRGAMSYQRRRAAAVATGTTVLIVSPFLINCWRATGDPFFAINYHTRYYQAAEGRAPDESVGVIGYLTRKLRERPLSTMDTGIVGVTVFPFTNKWRGFAPWSSALAFTLRWLAIAGLVLALWCREGRFLWMILLASLAPYAVTWPLGGGQEWRFTQHAYPFYLVAAGAALVGCVRAVNLLRQRELRLPSIVVRRRATQALVAAGCLAVAWTVYQLFPYFVVREALAAGDTVSIGGGERDLPFFGSKWSSPSGSGNVMVRVALGDRVSMRIPLPQAVDHTLTLRMDGPDVPDLAYQPKVTVFVNNRTVGQVRFRNDPTRVGTYRFIIPREAAGRSFSRLDLVASHTVAAADSGPRFAWLPEHTRVAFYLWYVRVEPHVIAD